MTKFRSPGRVNIIGEHTDYNNGFVLPFAIDKYIEVDVSSSNEFVFVSHTMNETVGLKKYEKLGKWTDYLMGVIWAIEKSGCEVKPVRIDVSSTLPLGAGLSSSAALETAVAYGLNSVMNLNLSKKQIVDVCVRAEREFVGVQCGIMDQFTVVFGKKDHAIFLDTFNLSYEYVPLNLGEYEFALIDSNTKHELSSSEYNKRREECERILKALHKNSFREITYEDLNQLEPALRKRARHVLDENKRVNMAVRALKKSEMFLLGNLLYESHVSLRDLYEVSCEEIDFIVGFLRGRLGILGARIVGGGFGGSVLVFGRKGCIEEAYHELRDRYYKMFGITPELIHIKSDCGVHAVV